ncbi:MAG: chemotaxis protein CheW [Gammaproteobacteria bacterium]|jgi:chemosensory pili system protein ChpC
MSDQPGARAHDPEQEEQDDLLHTLLLPLVGRRLLVPRACVAEVIGLARIQLREEDPGWLLGEVAWDDRMVPLVSFEAACGDPVPDIGGRSRAVILRSLTGKLGRGGLALLCQGLPQLVRVGADVVELDATDGEGSGVPASAPVLCRLRVLNETPAVPDLERLETDVAEILAGGSAAPQA